MTNTYGFKPSRNAILKVLKNDLRMSYRKIKRTPTNGNTERCKVLRCLWAQKFLGVLQSGQRVITIDETWLSESDYRRFKWSNLGQQCTFPEQMMGYKVNMIAAISTEGEIYVSFLQCNTDTDVYMMFMSRLASVLT